MSKRNDKIASLRNHIKYKELDAGFHLSCGGRSSVGAQSQRCPGSVENTHRETSSLVPFLGKAECH